MISTNRPASSTGSRRHHTPQLCSQSSSLTRRQDMIEHQGSEPYSVSSGSHQQQHHGLGEDDCMPGTVVVCGVRSAFPLIPADPNGQVTSGDAAPSATSPTAPPQRQSSTQPSNSQTPRSGLGRPPLVRMCDESQEYPLTDQVKSSAELSHDAQSQNNERMSTAGSSDPDLSSLHDRKTGSADESTMRTREVSPVTRSTGEWSRDASPEVHTKHSRTREHRTPERESSYTTMEATGVETSPTRRKTHRKKRSAKQGDKDQRASMMRHPSEGRDQTTHGEDRSAEQQGKRASPSSRRSPQRTSFLSIYAEPSPKTHRWNSPVRDVKPSARKTMTSADSARELLQRTDRRHPSSADKQGRIDARDSRQETLPSGQQQAISASPAEAHCASRQMHGSQKETTLERCSTATSDGTDHRQTGSNGCTDTFLRSADTCTANSGGNGGDPQFLEEDTSSRKAMDVLDTEADAEQGSDVPKGQLGVTDNLSSPHRSPDNPAADGSDADGGSDMDRNHPQQGPPKTSENSDELDEPRRVSLLVNQNTNSDLNEEDSGSPKNANEDTAELVSCYDVACQTSQDEPTRSEDRRRGSVESRRAGSEDGAVDQTGSSVPHYAPVNRWLCATGVCSRCHPNRHAKRCKSSSAREERPNWPITPQENSGYRPPRGLAQLHQSEKKARPATAGNNVPIPKHLAPLVSSARSRRSHPVDPPPTSTRQWNEFSGEWDLQLHQRQLWLHESSLGRKDPGSAYTSSMLLTSHQVREREKALGCEPRSYRYCDMASQKMMLHTGYICGDLEMKDYNDTLHGAPYIKDQHSDDDSAGKKSDERGRWKNFHKIKLLYPALPEASTEDSAAAETEPTTLSRHPRPPPNRTARCTTAYASEE